LKCSYSHQRPLLWNTMEPTDNGIRNVYAGISACLILISIVVRITLPVTIGSVLLTTGVVIFAKQKWLKWSVVPLCLAFNVATSYLLGFPIRYLMPLEGSVTDAETGSPIVSAIFDVEYAEYRPTLTITDIGREIDRGYAVTEKDGKYLVEGRFIVDFLHPNARRFIKLRHPLYETLDILPLSTELKVTDRECRKKEKAANIFHLDTCQIVLKPQQGVIHYNIQLGKLETKYHNDRRADETDISWVLNEMITYAAQAKNLNVSVEWNLIFAQWDRILDRFGGDKSTTKAEILSIVGKR